MCALIIVDVSNSIVIQVACKKYYKNAGVDQHSLRKQWYLEIGSEGRRLQSLAHNTAHTQATHLPHRLACSTVHPSKQHCMFANHFGPPLCAPSPPPSPSSKKHAPTPSGPVSPVSRTGIRDKTPTADMMWRLACLVALALVGLGNAKSVTLSNVALPLDQNGQQL